MADNNDGRNFVEIEDELNQALGKIGKNKEFSEFVEDRVQALTVQELLEQIRIDEFEKIYIATVARSSSHSYVQVPEDKMDEVKTLAEYQLEQRESGELVSGAEQSKLKNASNFYIIPHTVQQKYSVGNTEQIKSMDIYTINDVEGHSLYTIIDNQSISMTKSFEDYIKKYLHKHYPMAISAGELKEDEVIEYFTPHNIEDMYKMLSDDKIISMRFLP